MAQTVDQIASQIDRTRERLGSNLKELEQKVDAATDWREHYRARPYVMLGAACLGGVALAAALRDRDHDRTAGPRAPLHAVPRRGFDPRGSVLDLWDTVATALVAVASTAVKDQIAEWVPGFDEHFARAAQRTPR